MKQESEPRIYSVVMLYSDNVLYTVLNRAASDRRPTADVLADIEDPATLQTACGKVFPLPHAAVKPED